ncbi:MAG: hypothetical protein RIR88_793 [Actinomycetota bacterium]
MLTSDVTGVILAGGRSSRMGTDKAQLRVGQISLLERSARAQLPLVDEILILGSAPQPFTDDALSATVTWVEEELPFQGPVAALCLAAEFLTKPWVLVLPCDLAFPERAAAYLLAEGRRRASADADADAAPDAIIAQDGDGRTQWLTGLFRTAAIREKFLALPSTDVSVRAALEGLALATLAPPAGENRIWEDMDTPEDFQRVQEELS